VERVQFEHQQAESSVGFQAAQVSHEIFLQFVAGFRRPRRERAGRRRVTRAALRSSTDARTVGGGRGTTDVHQIVNVKVDLFERSQAAQAVDVAHDDVECRIRAACSVCFVARRATLLKVGRRQ